ncbi:Phosphoribosyl-dephospho-CoA transferase [Fundidesulfovibrio magnetotacticus]|uniref:Phosphoribosyl-dephospho-CoA transferase n=1 Tax=Fundidesulfovibrio magnetotacticus TaxID=2730080 RepID=A0A6V8LXG6_9BACT|nr:malonate decarboxylase holo-[acyl-carrier-protein] synthase [Fundidesulfovibrio magnetotacticus]GFK92975.1 Phosphoribosyl-dephospho-CoA transferase [Fundidesulfovibrio magnetotacticus]
MRLVAAHRHWFARLAPEAWAEGLVRPDGCAPRNPERIGRWIGAGLPLVVRRPCRTPDGLLCCGLALPPGEGGLRLPYAVHARAVLALDPPPLLRQCLEAAPAPWRSGLARLLQVLEDAGLAPRVFGSLAWAGLTGLDFLHAGSDVDLLVAVDRREALDALGRALADPGGDAPPVEAEVLLPDGGSFQWAEYARNTPKVLVKSDAVVHLASRNSLLDSLGA